MLCSCGLLVGGSGEEGEAAVEKVRLPVSGETFSYQTLDVVTNLQRKSMAFEIPGNVDSAVEIGIVRIDSRGGMWGYPGGFRFRAYIKRGFGKETLVDVERNFRVNESVMFRIESEKLGPGDGSPRKIVYEIEKTRKDVAKGYEAREDFAFLPPKMVNKRRPGEFNVLLISFDTLRPDHMGCYGYSRDTTPNIDKFAEKGLLFTQAISSSSWTTPAHYSLFTGLNPSAHGNRRTFAESFSSDRTLASMLRENGYYTIAVTGGGSVSSQFGFGNGFDIYREYASMEHGSDPARFADHEDDTKKIFDTALEWLEDNQDTRFFMFLHHFEAHMPYEDRRYLSDEGVESMIERRVALYDGDIARADSFFEQLMAKLESLGLISNTIIVFLSDHGDEFDEHYNESDIVRTTHKKTIPLPEPDEIIPEIATVDHAHSLYDELIRIPLIIYVPGFEPPERILGNQVRMIDVMPTLLDLLKIGCDVPMQGTSLLELMRDGEREVDPPAISEFTDIGPERKSIRKDGYKYVWVENPEATRYYTLRDINRFELFDLNSDPEEKTNIYERAKQMGGQFHRTLVEEIDASLAINETLRPDYNPSEGETPEIPEDVRKALKGLGYLQQ
jgi:arylsulfatase A-like enzyme